MGQNLTDLYTKLAEQENAIHQTRSIILNTSLINVKAENEELRQSVRIADNELKILGLRQEVMSFSKTSSLYRLGRKFHQLDNIRNYIVLNFNSFKS